MSELLHIKNLPPNVCNKEEAAALFVIRDRSPEDFITYLCRATLMRSLEQREMKAKPEFIQHCIDLYYQQKGKCAVSGIPMTYTDKVDVTQICINRIDVHGGFVPGNVRLTCFWIANAIQMNKLEWFYYFMQMVCVHHRIDVPFRENEPELVPVIPSIAIRTKEGVWYDKPFSQPAPTLEQLKASNFRIEPVTRRTNCHQNR